MTWYAVPQAPSGSVTNQAATFNYMNSISSTQQSLQFELEPESAQQGQPAQNAPQTYANANQNWPVRWE